MSRTNIPRPRVLMACPTWSGGEYALKQWAAAWKAQTYPDVGAFMVDNSEENLHYAHTVRAQGIRCAWLTRRMPYLWDTLELAWTGEGGIIDYAHQNGYDYIFSVEHDVVIAPEATEIMVARSQKAAKDGKPAVVSHRYHPRGQEGPSFAWDTLGCTLLPTEPLWQDRLLAKANYEIECFIVCKRLGYPRERVRDLFSIDHLKDPEDHRDDKFSATPAYDLYAKRKIEFNAKKEGELPPPETTPDPQPTVKLGAQGMTTEPEAGAKKQMTPGPAKLVGGDPPPAQPSELKMKQPVPPAGSDAPINLQGVSDKDDLLSILRQENRIRLNLGCGYQQIAGFIGVDFDPDLDPDVVSPVDDLSWLEDDTVDMIYASHVLEHLTMEESRVALKEWLRVLKPGGHLDVMVPDVNQVYLLWRKGAKWGDYAQICDELYINATAFGANLLADAIPEMHDTYGGPGHQHKQIFIHDMLLQRVLEAGYVEAHEVDQCFLRRSNIGEVMVQARKVWYPEQPPMPADPPATVKKE